jgi:hypothetical protein
MEINFSGNNSIDVNVEKNEKCFMCCNTTEYNEDGNCGVTIGDIETMKQFGWDFDRDIEALNSLKIGERYDSEEYGDTAFIIRLG